MKLTLIIDDKPTNFMSDDQSTAPADTAPSAETITAPVTPETTTEAVSTDQGTQAPAEPAAEDVTNG